MPVLNLLISITRDTQPLSCLFAVFGHTICSFQAENSKCSAWIFIWIASKKLIWNKEPKTTKWKKKCNYLLSFQRGWRTSYRWFVMLLFLNRRLTWWEHKLPLSECKNFIVKSNHLFSRLTNSKCRSLSNSYHSLSSCK